MRDQSQFIESLQSLADPTDFTLNQEKSFPFQKETPQRLADGTLEQKILYCLNGTNMEYLATGDNLEELERDWAFKYLEISDKEV